MLIVSTLRVVAPVPPKVLLAAPVKVRPMPRVVTGLKFMVPLFVRFPPTERRCVVIVPDEPVCNVALAATVTLLTTVKIPCDPVAY